MTIVIIPSENCLFCTPCKSFRTWMTSLFFPLALCNSEHSSICLLKFNTLEVKMSFPGTGFLSELFIQAFLLIIHSNHNSTSGESDRRELKKRTKNNWSMGDIVPATSLYIRKNQCQTKRGWLFLAACSVLCLHWPTLCMASKKRHGPVCREKYHSFPFFSSVWLPCVHVQKVLACKTWFCRISGLCRTGTKTISISTNGRSPGDGPERGQGWFDHLQRDITVNYLSAVYSGNADCWAHCFCSSCNSSQLAEGWNQV